MWLYLCRELLRRDEPGMHAFVVCIGAASWVDIGYRDRHLRCAKLLYLMRLLSSAGGRLGLPRVSIEPAGLLLSVDPLSWRHV